MRVVVVDDEKKMRDEIADYLKTFEKEQKVSVIAQVYESPEDFLEHYQKDADPDPSGCGNAGHGRHFSGAQDPTG